jgi:hypothetical protein
MAEAKNFLYAFCGKRKVKPTYNNTDAADGRFQSQVSYPDQIFATSCVKFSDQLPWTLINSYQLWTASNYNGNYYCLWEYCSYAKTGFTAFTVCNYLLRFRALIKLIISHVRLFMIIYFTCENYRFTIIAFLFKKVSLFKDCSFYNKQKNTWTRLPWIPEPSTVNNNLKCREGSGSTGRFFD